jgi:uncharacterized membrane protein (UPF0182 family)
VIVQWLERRSRRQVLIAAVLVGLYVLWRAAGTIAGVTLDRWWLDSVTDAPVWSRITVARVTLAAAAGVVTLVVLGGSVLLALRTPSVDGTQPGGIFRSYRERFGRAHTWLLVAVVAVVTGKIAHAASQQWQAWLLFRHGPDVGRNVPELGHDLGYYLFDLPFLDIVSGWLRGLLLATIGISLAAHLVSGAIRMPIRGARSNPRALAHLGLLTVVFLVAQALDQVFVRRAALATDDRGLFTGAGYTAVTVDVPTTTLLAVVAVLAGLLVVNAIRTDRWRAAVGGLTIWALLQLLLVVVVPTGVQHYVVGPAEGARELPYLTHNLEFTRRAYGLDRVSVDAATISDGLDDASAVGDGDAGRVPLFDVDQLPAALQTLAGTTGTRVFDADLDRYRIGPDVRPVVVGARSPSRSELPASGWVQDHLVYTHGNGLVAAPADRPGSDGRPDVDVLDDVIHPEHAELYFGEGMADWYAIVATKRAEQGGAAFAADTGLPIDGLVQRGVLALASGDVEPLFSAELSDDSQLLYRRDVTERIHALAPFLTLDRDPYPVATDDGITWIVDAYTTSSTYPYAEYTSLGGQRVNFAHASVKATVDGYDGTVHLYRTELGADDDPILAAWDEVFPGLLEPIADLPADLQSHLHYPADLLAAQAALLGRYHVDDAEDLFNGTVRWTPAAAPIPGIGQDTTGRSLPAYQILPDAMAVGGGHFATSIPYSPGTTPTASSTRNVLAALALADHDDPERLRLLTLQPSGGRALAPPALAQSAIDADPDLAARFALLNANGSTVGFGPMTPVVIDDGLLWIRSVIVNGRASTTIPRVYGVLAVSGGAVGFGDDVAAAIAATAATA